MNNKNIKALEEVLYDKSYTCPVCDTNLKSKGIRAGKNKVVSTDSDLYNRYSIVNPVIYNVIVCTSCGYAALSNSFETLRDSQLSWIKDQIASRYKPTYYPEFLTEKHAINIYKLALLNALVKKASIGERAYICLKIGWLYRDLGDTKNERKYLECAKRDFITAFSTERFPIMELDELTTMYIIADLCRQSGDFDLALRWTADLILRPDTPSRLKEKAKDLKYDIQIHKGKSA